MHIMCPNTLTWPQQRPCSMLASQHFWIRALMFVSLILLPQDLLSPRGPAAWERLLLGKAEHFPGMLLGITDKGAWHKAHH